MVRSVAPRLAACMVLGAFVWQFVQFASFEYRRLGVQREVKLKLKAGVPEDERTYFTFSVQEYNALRWLKPEKEFTLGQGFFDVIEKTVGIDGVIHLACMNDYQETALFAHLSTMVDQRMDQRGSGPNSLLTAVIMAKQWCSHRVQVSVPIVPALAISRPSCGAAHSLSGHTTTVWLPPRS